MCTDLTGLEVSGNQRAVCGAPAGGQAAVLVVTLGRRVRVVLRVTPACGSEVMSQGSARSEVMRPNSPTNHMLITHAGENISYALLFGQENS